MIASMAIMRNTVNVMFAGRAGAAVPSFGSSTSTPVCLRGGPSERPEDDCGSDSGSFSAKSYGMELSLTPHMVMCPWSFSEEENYEASEFA